MRPATSRDMITLSNEGYQALLVEDAARPALLQGVPGASLSPNANAAPEAASILANVEQEETSSTEAFLFLREQYAEFMNLLENLEQQFDEICSDFEKYRDQKRTTHTSKKRSSKRADAKSESTLTQQYQNIQEKAQDLQQKSTYLVSFLADLHKQFMGLSYEEARSILGERSDMLLQIVSGLGLKYDQDEGWKISPDGAIPKCHELILRFNERLSSYMLPDTADTEDPSTLRKLWDQFVELWHFVVEFFAGLRERLIFFILWLMKLVRDRLGMRGRNITDNPAAAYTQDMGRSASSSSLRSTISGRGDVGDDEQILRADPSSLGMQSGLGKRDDQSSKTGKNKDKKKK